MNQLGTAGAEALVQGLARNSTLQTLSVRENGLDDGGARALLAILNAPGSTLQTLHLQGNNLSDAALAATHTAAVPAPAAPDVDMPDDTDHQDDDDGLVGGFFS